VKAGNSIAINAAILPDAVATVAPNAARTRYTIDGSESLENLLDETCARVAAAVCSVIPPKRIEAIVLGGGYGRGQGGVLKTPLGDQPYNDLEFYVFMRGLRLLNCRRYTPVLNQLGEDLSAALHVEFKIDCLARLRRSPVTMFSYDLVSGHKTIFGNANCFAGCDHHLDASQIPLSEATRLLFNRSSGLLLANALMEKGCLNEDDADFIGRNLAKAHLACGDVVLTVFGQYHWSCVERNKRLNDLATSAAFPRAAEIVECHDAGMRFKLNPQRIRNSRDQFQEEHRAISGIARDLWLWLEARRLARVFASPREYAFAPINKCPETFSVRNFFLTAKSIGPRAVFGRRSFRYPRERLFNALCLLLWDDVRDREVADRVRSELQARTGDWPAFLAAYKRIWSSFG
jgi:hypothetical protein